MNLHLIYARAANGVIGKDGVMPWHLPEDLAHFKRVTMGHPVIMGRKTWESLPTKFRPLPGRLNIVVTRQKDWKADGEKSSEVKIAHSLEEAKTLCDTTTDAWVIGGAEIYAQALPLATSVIVTEIEASFEGDAYAPVLGHAWREAKSEYLLSQSGLPLRFVTYVKR